MAAVTTSQTVPDQLETLLRWLLPNPVVLLPPPRLVPSDLEQLLQRLRGGGGGKYRSLPHQLRLGSLLSKLCYRNFAEESVSGGSGSGGSGSGGPGSVHQDWAPCIRTGLRWCVSRVANQTIGRPGVLH